MATGRHPGRSDHIRGTTDLHRRWWPWFFLGSGTFAVFALLFVGETVTGSDPDPLAAATGAAGWATTFVGAAGLAIRLRRTARGAGTAALVLACLAAAAATVLAIAGFGEAAGLWGPRPPWLGALNLPLIIGIIFGLGMLGAVGLSHGAWPHRLGYVLLAPPLIFIINLARLTVSEAAAVSALLGACQALALLGVGMLLRSAASGHRGPTSAATAET